MNKKGFTLIELMIALGILAIILVALAQAAMMTIRHNASFDHRKLALELAQGTINSLASLPYNSNLISNQVNDNTFIDNPYPDPDGNGGVYVLDNDHNGAYSDSDISDPGDATKGIDHPASGSGFDYSILRPIEVITPVTYYKIWGVKDLTDMKEIAVVVYWFEGSSTRPHYVSLTTYKRSP